MINRVKKSGHRKKKESEALNYYYYFFIKMYFHLSLWVRGTKNTNNY